MKTVTICILIAIAAIILSTTVMYKDAYSPLSSRPPVQDFLPTIGDSRHNGDYVDLQGSTFK